MAKTVLTVLLVISGFLAGAWNSGGSTHNALPPGYKMVLESRGVARQGGEQERGGTVIITAILLTATPLAHRDEE